MGERFQKSNKLHVSVAINVQQRLRRCFLDHQRAGKIWIEPASIRTALRRMQALHKRYATGDLRHTKSEIDAQQEVMLWVYHQHCMLRGMDPKSEDVVQKEFAATLAGQKSY